MLKIYFSPPAETPTRLYFYCPLGSTSENNFKTYLERVRQFGWIKPRNFEGLRRFCFFEILVIFRILTRNYTLEWFSDAESAPIRTS